LRTAGNEWRELHFFRGRGDFRCLHLAQSRTSFRIESTSGTTLEVIFNNVPKGVIITPVSSIGSTNTLFFNPLPAAQTSTGAGNAMTFSFSFSSTDTSANETASLAFNAGFTSAVDVSAVTTNPITAKLRLGPVSTDTPPAVISFIETNLVNGVPFAMRTCQLQAESANVRLPQGIAGGSPTPGIGLSITERTRYSTPFSLTVSTTNGVNWLVVTPTSGTQPTFLTLVGDPTNLAAGHLHRSNRGHLNRSVAGHHSGNV